MYNILIKDLFMKYLSFFLILGVLLYSEPVTKEINTFYKRF